MAIFRVLLARYSCVVSRGRSYSSMSELRGLVLGAYASENEKVNRLTPFGQKFNDQVTSGKLLEQINVAGPLKVGQTRLLWNSSPKYPIVAVAGLGDAAAWDVLDGLDGVRENVRIAAGAGVKALTAEKVAHVDVEDFGGQAEAAAEGATLAAYRFQEYKKLEARKTVAKVSLAQECSGADDFRRGEVVARAQNWSRLLMETPANLMTPTIFAEEVTKKLSPLGVQVVAHDKAWAQGLGMESFLSVSKGSDEPPVFLEMTYQGAAADQKPLCLVGKGITFDSGGISIKAASKMDEMRADMGGGSVVVGTIAALAELKAKVNVKGLVPLCENLPNGRANKPGDVVRAMNGKSICIDNTDAEGRLILADALCYAERFSPRYIVDLATLTGAIRVALGFCVTGAFSTSDELYSHLAGAGAKTGDRVWRMPIFKHYNTNMTDYSGYDINNLGKVSGAGSCTAAAFLREFVPKSVPWMHLDIAGVMNGCDDQPYLVEKGMTGRPVRTIVEFIHREAAL
ncbi:cytosol aminopeptidase-like isoform X2 [Phlebotomus argentipes]|uniref:cytosol aminopeptidase-like isoform X2 n=1 Tax=Phlebotomus argentipes TaxID=94469 RepID=UPI00289366DF|nr:cytosol aminopeptidase-like isoform X2 [Phlebotomus argentipes]